MPTNNRVQTQKGSKMPEEAKTLTFESEAEKLQALTDLGDTPPRGKNTEEWLEETEEKRRQIEAVEVVPKAEEKEGEAKTPESSEKKESQAPEESKIPPEQDDIVKFEFKRSEMPDILKSYKDGDEMVKQMAHARTYANDTEVKVKDLAAEVEVLKAELTKKKEEVQASVAASPTPQPVAQSHLDELDKSLDSLNAMEGTEYVSVESMRNVIGKAVNEIGSIKKSQDTFKKEIDDFKTDFGTFKTDNEKTQKDNVLSQQQEAAEKGLKQLQVDYPELQTSKSITGSNNSVELDVIKFADRILSSKHGNDKPTWANRNVIINDYLREDPELLAYCQNNAITPESVGSTLKDIKNYATIVNVNAAVRGVKIDSGTGKEVQNISPYNDKPVNYDSYSNAYENIRRSSGIAQKEEKDALAEAEIKGQNALGASLNTRDTSPKTLGSAGEASPENIGEEITEQRATEIFNTPDLDVKIEFGGREGDYRWFHLYNKACKRLGMPESNPEDHWLPEKRA